MNLSTIIEALIEAGATPKMILAAVRADEKARLEEDAIKREATRQRVRKHREKSLNNKDRVTAVTVTPVTSVTSPFPLSSPLSSPLDGFPTPLPINPPIIPPSIPNPIQKPRTRVSLDDLSVDHIRDWLSKKRVEGRYLSHDENFILEYFKNFCRAKGKKYDNYVAALRNAFEWDTCQPKHGSQNSGQPPKSKWITEGDRLEAKYAAQQAELDAKAQSG